METPSVRRRLACLLYECVLLFAVLMIAGLVFSIAVQQRHALEGRWAAMAFLFLVIGLYFVWCWTRGGQTLAMQTWHIRVIRQDGEPVGRARALMRYLCGYVWLLPPLAIVAANGAREVGVWGTTLIVATWVLGYGLSARLHPHGQFWHDALCGTRLITWRNQRPAR
jgi:uncharacterized RDD family membrane protein YckC